MSKKTRPQALNKLNNIDSWLFYIILVSIFFISLTVRIKRFTSYYSYDFSRSLGPVYNIYTYYKLIGLIVLFVVSLSIFIYRSYKNKIKLKFDVINISIILIITSCIISFLFSPLKQEALFGYYTHTNGLLAYITLFGLFFIIANLSLKEKHLFILSHVVNALSIIYIIIGVLGFFGHYILNYDWFKNIYIPAEMRATVNINMKVEPFVASSILSQQNYFGAYCSIMFPFITIQAINAKKWIDKILFSIGSVMLFVGTYISVSMGPLVTAIVILPLFIVTFKSFRAYAHIAILLALSILGILYFSRYQAEFIEEMVFIFMPIIRYLIYGLITTISVLAIVLFFYHRLNKDNKYKLIAAILIICVIFAGLGMVYVFSNIAPTHMNLLSNRGYTWHYSYQMLKQNLVVGYGPDTFYYHFPQKNPDSEIYSKNTVFDKPHNMYLQVLSDSGLIGLAGFITLLVGSLLLLLKYIFNNSDSKQASYFKGIFFVIIAYMIQGIINDNHIVIQPILYLLIASGIAGGGSVWHNKAEKTL